MSGSSPVRKHRWSEPSRPSEHRTIRHCRFCGMIRITRHEPSHFPPHWTEFFLGSDKIDGRGGTPKCSPAESEAA